jgi:hypothetical protein
MFVDPKVEEPTREMLGHAIRGELDYPLREQDVYDYLSSGALGFKPIEEVLSDPGADYTLPVLITAQMLVAFRLGDGHDLWGYLDTVWNAVETAERADLSPLPALTLRSHRLQAAKKQ